MEPSVIIAIVGGLFGAGGIAAILKTRAENKKTAAEAEITLTGGWQVMWQTLRTENVELRERIVVLEKNEEECQKRLSMLERVAGLDPEKTVATLIENKIKTMEQGGPSGTTTA